MKPKTPKKAGGKGEDKGGRPTLYKPEYGPMLYRHMKAGGSFRSFAGKIGVTYKTLDNWCEANPEFLQHKKKGEAASYLWWENKGKAGLHDRNFNTGLWSFCMKNRFKWRSEPLEPEDEGEMPEKAKTYSRELLGLV